MLLVSLIAIVMLFDGSTVAELECSGLWEKSDLSRYLLQNSKISGICGIFISSTLKELHTNLSLTFIDDHVHVEILDSPLPNDDAGYCEVDPAVRQVFVLKPKQTDRTCLLKPKFGELENINRRLRVIEYDYIVSSAKILSDVVSQVNEACHLFREIDGSMSPVGVERYKILRNLYAPDSDECEVIDNFEGIPMTGPLFYREFLSRSKPVIFRSFAKKWPASTKWGNINFFAAAPYGSKRIHVKLSPSENYEGVEPRTWWTNAASDQFAKGSRVPEAVLQNLPYPDLVVVRPASAEMTLLQLVGVIKSISDKTLKNASAYLEYTPLESIDPSLSKEAPLPKFIEELGLHVETTNLWLSDGNTVGKLHFDGADNILVQLVGSKTLTIFDPHNNENLYEGHIQEAEFEASYELDENGNSSNNWTFFRRKLMDSTSMVMSPVDLANLDLQRFPKFARAKRMTCTINQGDALFLPAFWWHEVASKPCPERKFNLALNFWFRAFFLKDIPCPECRLDVNEQYHHFLELFR